LFYSSVVIALSLAAGRLPVRFGEPFTGNPAFIYLARLGVVHND